MTSDRRSHDERAHRLRRSMLFVPVHRHRFVEKAPSVGADAVVLDLEDSVAPAERPDGRVILGDVVRSVASLPLVIVRVNAGADLEHDLIASRNAGVAEVLLPKVESPADLDHFRDVCSSLGYSPDLSILVESSRGLAHLHAILDRGPITTIALGTEDLRAELEIHAPDAARTSPTLLHAHASVILAAAAANVTPIGLLGSIAQYRDLDLLARDSAAAWRMGYRGSFCVHPDQVNVFNWSFTPSEPDRLWACQVVEGAERARSEGLGSFVVDSKMIDAPLVTRAYKILRYRRPLPDLTPERSIQRKRPQP